MWMPTKGGRVTKDHAGTLKVDVKYYLSKVKLPDHMGEPLHA